MKTKANNKRTVIEGLSYGDLKGLISNVIMIDMHKPKIGNVDETVVVAFNVKYENPAKDLGNFLETDPVEHLDVEVSASPDKDGHWKVFVEFERNRQLYAKIKSMLNSVDQISSRENGTWKYKAYKVNGIKKFNKENFKNDIIDSRYEYRKKFDV